MSTLCPNCGDTIKDLFCPHCGQKKLGNDRSLMHLIGDLLGNLFFVDNRFWVSYKYLIFKPGVMTFEFLEGKRRKFISPIAIFLFINVLYFLFSHLSDYSLSLIDQMHQPTHGSLATQMVENKLLEQDITFEEYAQIYQRSSDNISKSIIILNVPMIAFFVYLLAIKKRTYYYDSLIYSLHFFSAFLLFVVIGIISWPLYSEIAPYLSLPKNPWSIWYPLFMFVLPLIYAILSFKKFCSMKWGHALWSGVFIILSGFVVQFIYRSMMFFITFWWN